MPSSKAFICGCSGEALTQEERSFLRRERPWGFILFRRNIGDPAQVRTLVDEFRACVDRADAPVLVDQEGGRVQRFGPPHWPAYPSAGKLAQSGADQAARIELLRDCARCMAEDLRDVGVDVDCAPVLDAPSPDAHAVIGDRAYGSDPAIVATLARAVMDGLLAGGVLPVIKHIPGHGRARADSHLELPVVRASRVELEQVDFAPFRALADAPVAMTAHVLYEAIDAECPATLSRIVVQSCIRESIGFRGLLLTDDLSMRALGGSFEERAAAAFDAGVDLALHCNGNLIEAASVASSSPVLDGASLERAERALALISRPRSAFDRAAALKKIYSATGAASAA